MTLTQAYKLTKNGKLLFKGTQNECFIKLLKVQGQSTDYALKYGGYKIEPYTGLRLIEDRPEEGKVYALTGAGKSIANGNTWKESEVPFNNPHTIIRNVVQPKKG